jgi:UTP--glucose-1-phosphate uridylyltransferase
MRVYQVTTIVMEHTHSACLKIVAAREGASILILGDTMKVTKAVITAAAKSQHHLPLQILIDRDGAQKAALQIIVEEALAAGAHDIAIIIQPGDADAYSKAAGPHARHLHFIEQSDPRGYGDAILRAKDFTHNEPFLHLVGDHLYLSLSDRACAQQVVQMAEAENCAVSAVQATRESQLPNYGAIGGRRTHDGNQLYQIERVLEKPTPTEAEQSLIVPGLRAGYYLCFFGIHVLTPQVMALLASIHSSSKVELSSALNELAQRERYLALALDGQRYDIGVRYGVWMAQLALALAGKDRADVLANMVEVLSTR